MYFPFPTEEINEGSVALTIPKLTLFSKGFSEYIPSKAPVFYNPRMELNRDISVLALRIYQKKINQHIQICDPLTGCGVRGLRFAREVDGVNFAVLNDISLNAARLAWFNAKKNGLDAKVFVERMDARALLGNYTSYGLFNAIDLDPYGSPSLFLGFALMALKNRGLLALTATDMGPLCGVNSKACIRKYFAKSLRTEYCHELALRILINSVARLAAQYNRGIKILFSHSTDHYIRAYVQVRHGAKRADEAIKNSGYILHCFKCLNRKWLFSFVAPLDSRCEVCGDKLAIAGPLWLGELADLDFCREIYEETEKIFPLEKKPLLKLLSLAIGEVNMPPTYFVVDKICKNLGSKSVSRDRILRTLVKIGYKASRTHFNSQGIKSNATILTIKETVKEMLI